MKKNFFLLFLCLTGNMYAQHFYGGLTFQNQWGLDKNLLWVNATSPSATTYEYGSLGQGISLNSYTGYQLNQHIGFELDAQYFHGTRHSFFLGDYNAPTGGYSGFNTLSVNSFRIIPSLRMSRQNEKGSVYIREGFVIGVRNRYYIENVIVNADENKSVSDGGIATGFHSAIGATVNINKWMAVFVEVNTSFLNWAPKEYHLTKSLYRGNDKLASMSVYEKEAVYTDHVESTLFDPDQPRQFLKIHLPMNSAGVCMGLHFRF